MGVPMHGAARGICLQAKSAALLCSALIWKTKIAHRGAVTSMVQRVEEVGQPIQAQKTFMPAVWAARTRDCGVRQLLACRDTASGEAVWTTYN